jgi:hypothetical protein
MCEQEEMSNTLSQGQLFRTRFQSYPVDIALRIEKCEGTYTLFINMSGYQERFPIKIKQDNLVQLSNKLHKALSQLVGNNGDISLTNEDLHYLALEGYDAFLQVFGDIDIEILAAIQDIIADKNKCFEIISDEFILPWEVIYPNNPHDEEVISLENFWGLKHIIYRVICNKPPSPPKINSCPRLGLLAYEGLPAVQSLEVPQFYDHEKRKLIYLRHLGFTSTNFIAEFRDFWKNDFDLTHFACHAQYNNDYEQSYIRIHENFDITIQDIRTFGIKIKDRPLMFINACGVGVINPLSLSNFVNIFLKHGARGAIATECTLPDGFAADFSKKFYEYFLEQKRPLGESLLATRQYFLRKCNNPSGLLYSMYAPPNIQLASN